MEEIDPTSQLAEHGEKLKVDPSRLLFGLRWLNPDEPPDLNLTLVRDPALWFSYVTTMLLGALNRDDPHLFDAAAHPLKRARSSHCETKLRRDGHRA